MTTLAITPNWKNKTAKFKGTVAAGEHVSVTIQNENGEGEAFISDASTLRLRVVDPCNGRTLAIFPEPVPEGETPETWDSDLSPLRCTLNLNTVQMLKAIPPAANVPLLWVLDDYDNNTLYFKEQFPVEHWPRLRGEEEPTDLDNYKDIIADFNTRLTTAEQTVATAAANAQNAAASASAAAASASTAATAATDAQAGAIASKNAAQTAANDAASAKTAAETAQGKAEEAQEAAETAQGKAQEYAEAAAESAAAFVVDDTLSVEGAAADAKAVGEANQDLITRIETVQDNLDAETTARGTLAAAVGDNRQNLAAEIARAQSAEQGLENRKADKTAVAAAIQAETSRAQTAERDLRSDVSSAQSAIADRYTKTEVDAKIAAVQTFQKYLVQTLPAPEAADYKGLYLVPTGETSEEGDLCEEWTVIEEDGEKRWELIGGTTVDLSDYYDKDAVDNLLDDKQDVLTFDSAPTAGSNNSVKSGGIWSALWGALSALPTGFTSLYDWCVAQLAGKASTADATLTPIYGDIWVISPSVGPHGEPLEITYGIYWSPITWALNENIYSGKSWVAIGNPPADAISLTFDMDGTTVVATRQTAEHVVVGYRLGPDSATNPNRDKPLASEAEAEALRAGKMSASATGADILVGGSGGASSSNIATAIDDLFRVKADLDSPTFTGTPVAPTPQDGENSTLIATTAFVQRAIPYSLVTKTISNGAVTLDDRAINAVAVSSSLASLTVNFPTATSGKARDFGLRLTVASGITTAPELALPQGVTCENADGAAPEIGADGAATILYFTETASGVFLVKGEVVTAIS